MPLHAGLADPVYGSSSCTSCSWGKSWDLYTVIVAQYNSPENST